MPFVEDAPYKKAYRRARGRVGDASPGVKTQATLHGRKFNFQRQPTTAAAVRVEETFRRLAERPLLHAPSAPGAGNGEYGTAPLTEITGFRMATHLPPAGSTTPGDAERRRKILAAVGAVVAFAASRWPRHDPDVTGRLTRAAYRWNERNRHMAGASRAACRHTHHEWPGRLEADQPGSRVFYRQPRRGFTPPGGHAIEDGAAAGRRG